MTWFDRDPSGRELATSPGDDGVEAADEVMRTQVAQGIVCCDMATAWREHEQLMQAYFGTVIPPGDDDIAALDTTVRSRGSFVYIPPGVEVQVPLQSPARTDSEPVGQYERTLIIAGEGSSVHYIEGCSAPVYTRNTSHTAVVEIVVEDNARVTHTSIQNWSPNVSNLVTKRARVGTGGHMEWIEGNIGSKHTVSHPAVHLVGEGATGAVLSVAYAGKGQHQEVGAQMVHAAPNTTSKIVSKSISKDGGITAFRDRGRIDEGVAGTRRHVESGVLVLGEHSMSDIVPLTEIGERDTHHCVEATVSRISDEQIFHLMSSGLSQEESVAVIVNGFVEPVVKMLPMEYAVEWSRLIELQMDGAVG